jgi:hypothetical protein
MFQKKTRGNLSERERRTLTNLITELQLNYVDELKREPAGAEAEKTPPAEAPAPAEEAKGDGPAAPPRPAPPPEGVIAPPPPAPERPAEAAEAPAAEAEEEKAGPAAPEGAPEKKAAKRGRKKKKQG